jgi:uncharacterized protein (TIGR02448 family)
MWTNARVRCARNARFTGPATICASPCPPLPAFAAAPTNEPGSSCSFGKPPARWKRLVCAHRGAMPPTLGNRMKLRSVSLSLALLAAAGPVMASSFAGTTAGSGSEASSDSTSDSSGSTSGDDKIVLDAREDAASFVASDGQIRSARLEAALAHLRQSNERARVASDLQLARLILTL